MKSNAQSLTISDAYFTSISFRDSEAFASEFLEDLVEMFPRYYIYYT